MEIHFLKKLATEISSFMIFSVGVDVNEAYNRLTMMVTGVMTYYMKMSSFVQNVAKGKLDALLSSVFFNLRDSSESAFARSSFDLLGNISFEELFNFLSYSKSGDKYLGGAYTLSLVLVAIDEAFNKTTDILDLRPIWRERMPDRVLEEILLKSAGLILETRKLLNPLNLLTQLTSMLDGKLPTLSADAFEIQENESDVMKVSLSEIQDKDWGVLVKVHDSERLTLSGENVTLIDDSLGKYLLTFTVGTTQIDVDVFHHIYGDITDANSLIDFYLLPLKEVYGTLNNAEKSSVTITLSEYELSDHELPPASNMIDGDYEWLDTDPQQDGIQVQYDDLGNPVSDPQSPKIMDDVLNGSLYNDQIESGGGQDTVNAKHGDDEVAAGEGDAVVYGRAGNDWLQGGEGNEIIIGGIDDDHLYATADTDVADLLNNEENIDIISRDWLAGGDGDDLLVGSAGENGLAGGSGQDTIYAGSGNDTILGDTDSVAQNTEWSYEDIDHDRYLNHVAGSISAEPGSNDVIFAGAGNDWVLGEDADDIIHGEAGDDFISGDSKDLDAALHGNDILYGNAGDDFIIGGSGDDFLYGGEDNDRLQGDTDLPGELHGSDYLHGQAGNDVLYGEGGSDSLYGGEGDDSLSGDEIALNGQYHAGDWLDGGMGNDKLWGQGGDDTLYGGDGNDYIEGDDAALSTDWK